MTEICAQLAIYAARGNRRAQEMSQDLTALLDDDARWDYLENLLQQVKQFVFWAGDYLATRERIERRKTTKLKEENKTGAHRKKARRTRKDFAHVI